MKNYSFLQQQLHHLSLGSSFVKNSLFEIEKIFFKTNEKDIVNNQHVFISGLPRSGTTIYFYIFTILTNMHHLHIMTCLLLLHQIYFQNFTKKIHFKEKNECIQMEYFMIYLAQKH